MSNATSSSALVCIRDGASVIFNLPEYDVIDAADLPTGGPRVVVQAVDRDDACPDYKVISMRVHQRTRQQVAELPAGGAQVEVVVREPRMLCAEPACDRRTFLHITAQLPLRARCLTRLRNELVDAVINSGRAIEEVASWTVQTAINTAAVTLPDPDAVPVRHLGIDEHRFARARFFRDDASGSWRRVEPWMSTFVNAETGQVLGIIDSHARAGIQAWLEALTGTWRAQVEVVAFNPSAPFRSAITQALPGAKVSVDHWHLVHLANLALTKMRQRVAREQLGHRARKDDLAWAHRMLLLHAGDRLSIRAQHHLEHVLLVDDPTESMTPPTRSAQPGP